MVPEEVPGRISNEAAHELRVLARAVPADRLIVEVGAYKGKSTTFLAAGSSEGDGARILSIDAWDTPGERPGPRRADVSYVAAGNQRQHADNVRAAGFAHLVTQLKGLSSEVPLPAVPVGLLFIDAAHDYESVLADARRFGPLVADGGWVVFDDYGLHCPGVDRAVDRLRRRNRAWTGWETRAGRLAIARRRSA